MKEITKNRHHGTATDLTAKSIALALAQQSGSNRNTALLAVSLGLGLRAAEMAGLTWAMVVTEEGFVGDTLRLPNGVAKMGSGGTLPLSKTVIAALEALLADGGAEPSLPIFKSQKGGSMKPQSVVNLFRKIWQDAGIDASSHSGRRHFITQAARAVSTVGGSLRDVQMLARHKNISVTQNYICPNTKAQIDLVALVGKTIR